MIENFKKHLFVVKHFDSVQLYIIQFDVDSGYWLYLLAEQCFTGNMIDNFKKEKSITLYSYNTLTQSDAASELVIVELYNLVALNSFPSFGRA